MNELFRSCSRERQRVDSARWALAVTSLLITVIAASAALDAPAQAPPSTASSSVIPTLLEHLEDGTVAVLFQGEPGARYQIRSSETLADPPLQTQWQIAADDVVATAGWTVWIDVGGPGRAPSAAVAERYYQVIFKSPPSPTAAADGPAVATDSSSTLSAATTEPQNERLARLQEAYDSGQLVGALATEDHAAALDILRRHGVSETSLAAMSSRLGQPAARVPLVDDFLKAVFSWGPVTAEVQQQASARGFTRLLRFTDQPVPASWTENPIACFRTAVREPDLIQYFKWFDVHADELHSVVLNTGLNINEIIKGAFADANSVFSALFKLIKARRPETFVWMIVVQLPDGSDEHFLNALDFPPDGLLVGNLDSFRSPFDATINRLRPLVAEETVFMALDFHGYWPQVYHADPAEYGQLVGPHLAALETKMRALGYRGLVANQLLIKALEAGQQ